MSGIPGIFNRDNRPADGQTDRPRTWTITMNLSGERIRYLTHAKKKDKVTFNGHTDAITLDALCRPKVNNTGTWDVERWTAG